MNLFMKKFTEKLQRIITPKTLAFFLTVMFVVSLIPLLMIAQYNYPSADDYGIGSTCRQAWVSSHSVFQTIWQAVLMAWNDYFNWMGYFTSIFLMAIHPGVFGEQFYAVTTWIMLGMISFSTMYLLHAILVKALKGNKYVCHSISMLLLFVSIQCMVGRVEAFYWYCGAVNYMFLHSMSLFFFGALISAAFDKGKKRTRDLVIASVLGFFTGGGNQITALNVVIVLAAAMGIMIVQKKWKKKKALWIPMGLFFFGFILNVAAPGNWVRAEGTTGMNPVKAVFVSFYYGLDYALSEWTGWPVLVLVIALIPLFWHIVKGIDFQFPYPVVVVLFAFCLVSAMVTPPLFAIGNIEAGRLQALMFLMYILVLTLTVGYMTGWARKKLEKGSAEAAVQNRTVKKCETEKIGKEFFPANQVWCLLGCILFFVFASMITVIPEPHYFTFTSAITDLANGSAKAYGETMKERAEILNSTESIAIVPPLTSQPALLYFDDITEDAQDWKNRGAARFYQKEAVIVQKEQNQ